MQQSKQGFTKVVFILKLEGYLQLSTKSIYPIHVSALTIARGGWGGGGGVT